MAFQGCSIENTASRCSQHGYSDAANEDPALEFHLCIGLLWTSIKKTSGESKTHDLARLMLCASFIVLLRRIRSSRSVLRSKELACVFSILHPCQAILSCRCLLQRLFLSDSTACISIHDNFIVGITYAHTYCQNDPIENRLYTRGMRLPQDTTGV